MALMNCYECGGKMSDKAGACPHCGAPPIEEITEDIIPISEETEIAKPNEIEKKIILIRDVPVLLDSDVAEIYGVETRDINKSVKNNPIKFPEGFIFELNNQELANLRWKFSTTNLAKTRVLPKAFTEQGLYMLATILKGEKAAIKTIEIVETFTRMRQFARVIKQVVKEPDKEKQKPLMKRAGDLVGQILDNDLELSEAEMGFELNLAVMKLKHTAKYVKKTK